MRANPSKGLLICNREVNMINLTSVQSVIVRPESSLLRLLRFKMRQKVYTSDASTYIK